MVKDYKTRETLDKIPHNQKFNISQWCYLYNRDNDTNYLPHHYNASKGIWFVIK